MLKYLRDLLYIYTSFSCTYSVVDSNFVVVNADSVFVDEVTSVVVPYGRNTTAVSGSSLCLTLDINS